MAQAKRQKKSNKTTLQSVKASRSSFIDRIQGDLDNKNAILNLILGVLIVVVASILVFNYFNKGGSDLGPAQQADTTNEQSTTDVQKNSLPGNYTVKTGDTLFSIAQQYYDDGYKYPNLVKANNLTDENSITVGQVITIPKLDQEAGQTVQASPTPTASTMTTPVQTGGGTGGAENQTIWGEKIAGDTYTVQAEDWLSKISGRAYGDIYAFEKIAKANNIADPNLIEPGTVLKIPR